MASLGNQVEGLTSLSFSDFSAPTTSQVVNFLVDGVKDVVTRVLVVRPYEENLFSVTDTLDNGTTSVKVDSGNVISVLRENGTANQLIPADRIPISLKYLSTDLNSLHYRSAMNPGYYLENKKVYVVPTPAATGNKAKVEYVSYPFRISFDIQAAAFDFPVQYLHLVILYASCRTLVSAMGNVINNISDYIAPTIISRGDPTGALYSDPELLKAHDDLDISTLSKEIWENANYDFDKDNIDVLKWFQIAGDMIQKQEDFELADAQISKISTYISAYNAALSNRSNIFDKKLQKETSNYQWMSERHQRLFSEYMAFFATLAGPQTESREESGSQQRGRAR